MSKKDIIGILFVLLIIWFVVIPFIRKWQEKAGQVRYATDLKIVYKLIQIYAEKYGGYPAPDKWCDELVKHANLREDLLFCSTAGNPLYYDTADPNTIPNFAGGSQLLHDEIDVNGQHHYYFRLNCSHYAFNPNAKPHFSSDVVLLFSTKGGWNQFGGPEIFSNENYKGIGRVGGYVLFNNGDVKFVKPKDESKLNWGKAIKDSNVPIAK